MKNYFPYLLLVTLFLLTSCSSTPEAVIVMAPAPDTPVVMVPTRDTLNSEHPPISGYGAYGYVIFTKRPIDNPTSNANEFCEAYRAGLEPSSSFPSIQKSHIMPTFWLLKSDSNNSCKSLVKNYDYAKAKLIASAIKKLDVAGPILVAWTLPFEEAKGLDALVLDLSEIQTEQYSEVIGTWSSRITRSPDMWSDGFNIEKIRIALKSFLNKNGDSIVSVIEWFKETAS